MKNSFLLRALLLLIIGSPIGLFLPYVLAIPSGLAVGMINMIVWMALVGILSFKLGQKLGKSILWAVWLAAIAGGAMLSGITNISFFDSLIEDSSAVGWTALSVFMVSFVYASLFRNGTLGRKWTSRSLGEFILRVLFP